PGMTIPVQVISDDSAFSLERRDLSDYETDGCRNGAAAHLNTLAEEIGNTRLDLENAPLFHATLATLSPSRHALLVNLPAFCADAAALDNLASQVSAAYQAALQSKEFGDEEALQYVDLSEWQNEMLASDEAEDESENWYRKMVAAPIAIRLLGKDRPASPDKPALSGAEVFTPRAHSQTVRPDVLAKIRDLIARYNTSPQAFYLACWQTLLWRISRQPEILLGLGCHGRTYEELTGAIGLFAKTLPFPIRIDGDMKLADILETLDEAIEESFDQQEYFTWDLVAKACGDNAELPFFALNFDFEGETKPHPAGLVTFSIGARYTCVDRFNLKLTCTPTTRPEPAGDLNRSSGNSSLITTFHYAADLFDATEIERLAGMYHNLLASIVAGPASPIDALNILSEVERHRLLIDFNNTAHPPSAAAAIHKLIEAQAASTPDSPAVIFGDEQLTYAELNARANQLAHHLIELGAGPDIFVGLYTENSLELMAGLLGILKTGGAYIPLDPSYPAERIAFMLEDTQAPIVLTQEKLSDNLPQSATPNANILPIPIPIPIPIPTSTPTPPLYPSIANQPTTNPNVPVTPDNLAYIIYTSGSTGKPKGVPITHRNLVHSTHARTLYYDEPVERYLLLSSFVFDSSVPGIFWPLIQGGALVLPQTGLQRDPRLLTALIERQQITHALGLPSLYSLILKEDAQKLASLKTMIVAGEACPRTLIDQHNETLPNTALYNEYGPTEGTVWSTVFDCRGPEIGSQVPIGKPIPNTQVYILNAHLQPAPTGVPGELHIGGQGVAQGYLNRPEQTSERFITDPFSNEPGARLYKTGDLARYLPDGNIEFLGRVDHQVKIRGYRVELGEIETVMNQHPAIRETAVIAREDIPGDKRLVAYAVAHSSEKPAASDLRLESIVRDYLRGPLPEYMLPSAFVFLDRLPLTPNGKVDRNRLPAPDRTRPDLTAAFVAPRNPTEKVLAGIWTDLLNFDQIGQVGIHDNFFELGGHSLLVTQLVARVRDTLPVDLPLRVLFDNPTIADLSGLLLQNPDERPKIEKTAELLVQVAQLSEDEVETMLTKPI
ncbi:MAG: amino acid adenylation domain-containing protein, partial [Anaerolineales bacterium]